MTWAILRVVLGLVLMIVGGCIGPKVFVVTALIGVPMVISSMLHFHDG